jgi:hypothetical protein
MWALLLVPLLGCGGRGPKPVYPVTGEVFYQGKEPCAGALVVLHPAGAATAVDRPNATVREDGTFRLSTFAEGDGAPAGEYGVTIVWPRRAAAKGFGDLAQRRAVPDRLGGRYADPKNPRLKARVEKKPTALPRFNVE